MKEIVLDTETTGLSVNEGNRIVEIGCIELDNFIPTTNIYHQYLNPERAISDEAFKIHGYSNEFLSKQKKFPEIVESFLNFIRGKKIIIHNAKFDLSFLNYELKLLKKNQIKSEDVIDTLEIARSKFPGSPASLDALCKRYKIDNSQREKHNAIIDCELLSKVYINLFDQKEPKLGLSFSNKIQDDDKNKLLINKKYSKKIVSPNKQETILHIDFIKKNLKRNYF